MDVSTAGAWAALAYQSALQSGTQAQALGQAFQAVSAIGSQTAQLAGSGTDGSILNLSVQPAVSLAAYQLASQSGAGAAAVQSQISATPSADLLLVSGLDTGSQSFPLSNPNAIAAWAGFQYAQAVSAGQTPSAYAQQSAALASIQQSSGTLNLLA